MPRKRVVCARCRTVSVVKMFYRLIGLVVLGAVAFVALGPLLPPGNPIGDAADTFLRSLRAFWGVPITSVSP